MADACDFSHTSLLNFPIDLHPIAQAKFFRREKARSLTERCWLKVESHGSARQAEVNRPKVLFPASVWREFWIDRSHFLFPNAVWRRAPGAEMGSASNRGFEILHPVNFFWHLRSSR
ncbi:hypothetical protein [Microcoleus sp. S36b_A2]|uniref:hypothetical protein n=1 Tax=Microcoleus sp. S36b_A2 TaxID=3055418 RepID=UPI002FD59B64